MLHTMNIATRTSKADLLFYLSPNVEVAPETVTELVNRLQPDPGRPRRSSVGSSRRISGSPALPATAS